MARDPAAALDEAAMYRKTRVQIDQRHELFDLCGCHQLGIDAVNAYRIGPAPQALEFVMAVCQRQHAPLAQHHIEIELVAEILVEL